jgi:endonuclease-3
MAPFTPREILDLLNAEYGTPSPHPHRDPLSELVLTILSQNTSDTNSGRAFARLLAAYPDWREVMTTDVRSVEEAIRPGGLAPSKGPRIQAMLREVWARRSSLDLSFLQSTPIEEARAWLRSLPGVGPKTAACVLLFSLEKPALPVDTHVLRVARRLGLVPPKTPAERAHDLLEAMLEPEEVYPFHINLIEHGRRTCLAQRPRCPQCVLRHRCPSAPLLAAEATARR